MEYYRTRPIITKHSEKKVNRSNNTMASKERILSAICSYAVRKGYMRCTPFGKREDGLYQVHEELYGDIFYLTKEERDHLTSFSFTDPKHDRARDIFIFQCHVGCRVSDLMSLTSDNIQDGFLQYIPIKTRGTSQKVVRVPLDETAMGIIRKYSGSDQLLPFMNEVAYNEYIHIIAKEAGLNRKVILLKNGEQISKELWEVCTSHTARKTFSQNIFKHTKSEVVASSFTGHSPNTRVFSRYAVVDDDMKKDIIDKVQ